jgi:integrase
MALLLFTGLRSGDVRRIGPQHMDGRYLRVKQEKTGAELMIPIHRELRRTIDGSRIGNLAFIVLPTGAATYTAHGFSAWFTGACRTANLPHCCAHGLRHAAARRLAEAGATSPEIVSITGHRSLALVSLYTRQADQRRLADSAIAKVEQTEAKPVANPDYRLANSGKKPS